MNNIIDGVLVIKIGTSTLMKKNEDGSESLDLASFARIGEQIIELQRSGRHIIIVSSAAITAGMVATGVAVRPSVDNNMPGLQRLASIGWRHVLNAWDEALGGVVTGELLLTHHDLGLSNEREELLRVVCELMTHGDVAIVNENDAITHREIAFGDNDTLAATLAAQIARSGLFGDDVKLVILSDVDGVYRDVRDASSVIGEINNIDEYECLAQGTENQSATGGMVTKFVAAKIATSNGVEVYITNGRSESTIQRALNAEIGTLFYDKSRNI